MTIGRDLAVISQFSKDYEAFSESRTRWIWWRTKPRTRTRKNENGERVVEELEPNGFASAFIKVAGRLYVDTDRFFEIIKEQNR